jgi:hypothetical protein
LRVAAVYLVYWLSADPLEVVENPWWLSAGSVQSWSIPDDLWWFPVDLCRLGVFPAFCGAVSELGCRRFGAVGRFCCGCGIFFWVADCCFGVDLGLLGLLDLGLVAVWVAVWAWACCPTKFGGPVTHLSGFIISDFF